MNKNTYSKVLIFGATGDIGYSFLEELSKVSDQIDVATRKKEEEFELDQNITNINLIPFNYPNSMSVFKKIIQDNSSKYDLVINAIGFYENDTHDDNLYGLENNWKYNFLILRDIFNAVKNKIHKDGFFINIGSIASHSGGKEELSYSISKMSIDKFLDENSKNPNTKFRIVNVRPGAVISRITKDRKDSDILIEPSDLATFTLNIVQMGSSINIPVIDIYRNRY